MDVGRCRQCSGVLIGSASERFGQVQLTRIPADHPMTTDHDPIVFVISDDDECPTTSNMSTAKDLQAAVVLDIPKPTPAPKKNRGQPPGYIAPKNTGKASGYRPLNHNANESQLYIQRPNLQNHPYASSQNPKPKNDYIDQDCVLYHIQGGSHQPSSHDLFALNTVPDSAIMLPSPAQVQFY